MFKGLSSDHNRTCSPFRAKLFHAFFVDLAFILILYSIAIIETTIATKAKIIVAILIQAMVVFVASSSQGFPPRSKIAKFVK